MTWIGGARLEPQRLVPRSGFFVLGMHEERPNSGRTITCPARTFLAQVECCPRNALRVGPAEPLRLLGSPAQTSAARRNVTGTPREQSGTIQR